LGASSSCFSAAATQLQQRQLAVVVEVHAHAQVDLGGVGVGVELLVQAQDRVARGHFDGGKEADMGFLKVGGKGAAAGGGGWQPAPARYADFTAARAVILHFSDPILSCPSGNLPA
jgi:hypothetical protein